MELRIFRSWSWVPDYNGRLGGTPQYRLAHQDQLQFREQSWMDWKPIPIEEGEKPKHPDDAKREQEINELNMCLDKMIESGIIKL